MTTHTSDLSLRRRPIDVLQRQEFLVRALRILGLLTVVWGELGSYLSVLWTCRWPDNELVRILTLGTGRRQLTSPFEAEEEWR